jgi:hypothetical protein
LATAAGLTLPAYLDSFTKEGFRLYPHRHHYYQRNDYHRFRHDGNGQTVSRSPIISVDHILQTVKLPKKMTLTLFLVCDGATVPRRQKFGKPSENELRLCIPMW